VGPTHRARRGLRHAEVPDLSLADEFFDRARDVFDWHLGIHSVLIEEIDYVGFESLERSIGNVANMVRPTVRPAKAFAVRGDVEPELRREYNLGANRSEGFADQFLVNERPVDFGRIEEGHAAIHGCPQEQDHFLTVSRRVGIAFAHSHTAETDR
jgi:hypothetical protein